MAPYWDEHDAIGIDATARSHQLFHLDEAPAPAATAGTATQVLADPAADHDWTVHARIDPAASDEEARAVLELVGVTRLT
jgi:hypothetical protein